MRFVGPNFLGLRSVKYLARRWAPKIQGIYLVVRVNSKPVSECLLKLKINLYNFQAEIPVQEEVQTDIGG